MTAAPTARQRAIAEHSAAASVRVAFKGRKGHGGGPCLRRVFTRDYLEAFVQAACLYALDQDRHPDHHYPEESDR